MREKSEIKNVLKNKNLRKTQHKNCIFKFTPFVTLNATHVFQIAVFYGNLNTSVARFVIFYNKQGNNMYVKVEKKSVK